LKSRLKKQTQSFDDAQDRFVGGLNRREALFERCLRQHIGLRGMKKGLQADAYSPGKLITLISYG